MVPRKLLVSVCTALGALLHDVADFFVNMSQILYCSVLSYECDTFDGVHASAISYCLITVLMAQILRDILDW